MGFGIGIFTVLPDGDLELDLGADEREALRSLPAQLAGVLREAPGDPAVARLAPPAYADEPEYEEEYRRYMGDDLRQRQVAALDVMSETAGAERLTPEQAEGWLAALNSLRLVLGSQLGVTEDSDEPDDDPDPSADGDLDTDDDLGGSADSDPGGDRVAHAVHLYHYLSMLLEDLVRAMAGALPEVPDEP